MSKLSPPWTMWTWNVAWILPNHLKSPSNIPRPDDCTGGCCLHRASTNSSWRCWVALDLPWAEAQRHPHLTLPDQTREDLGSKCSDPRILSPRFGAWWRWIWSRDCSKYQEAKPFGDGKVVTRCRPPIWMLLRGVHPWLGTSHATALWMGVPMDYNRLPHSARQYHATTNHLPSFKSQFVDTLKWLVPTCSYHFTSSSVPDACVSRRRCQIGWRSSEQRGNLGVSGHVAPPGNDSQGRS